MSVLLDPRVFNFIILALYAMNVARWLANGSYADACYWASAFGITATVTFGYKH